MEGRGSEVRRMGYMSRIRPMEGRERPNEERECSRERIEEIGVERREGFRLRALCGLMFKDWR